MLLLDEPSLGLAPKIVDMVFEALAGIRDRGLAVLLVEQRAQRTVALASRTHVISNGAPAPDPDPRGRGRHADDGGRLPLVIAEVLNIDWQVLADAVGLGSIYALMAVGIGLVFGVLRLVNFAYGQLIMAGAFALAIASSGDGRSGRGSCSASPSCSCCRCAMERLVFRPLRTQSPSVMLVATFAISFLLQSIALLWFGPLGKIAASLA